MQDQIVINNNLISYSRFGTGEKDVLFLHGWRSNKEVWQPVINHSTIQPSNYSIYAMDLPGFGQSSIPKEKLSLDRLGTPPQINSGKGWGVGNYAEVVKEFIEKLELKNVIIIGHSFGGRVGIKLCAMASQNSSKQQSSLISNGLTSPLIPPHAWGWKISKLVLVDAAGFAMPSGKKSLMAIAAKILRPFFKPRFMQGLRRKIYQKIGAEDYLATPSLQETFVNVVNEDLTEEMKRIAISTLIIWGENDEETPVEFGKRMNSIILNSRFMILKNAGHFSFLDKPEEFVNEIERFIK